MSMRGAVAGCVVLVCLVALLAERTEGHITFFSPKEMMEMKEREGRKETRETGVTTAQPPTELPMDPLPRHQTSRPDTEGMHFE
ncbi:motilin-like [Halichoeres trimaculatus]|uniref:motilin-like n=1 Tax=Halichoeres trimaculatus TaxID=147232 RepID=UPI003D9F5CA2